MSLEPQAMPTVKASQIADMLQKGMDRKQIANQLGISVARLTKLIQSSKTLSKMRPARNPVTFVDDLDNAGAAIQQPTETADPNQLEIPVEDLPTANGSDGM